MRAIDTNVLVRLLVRDDDAQARAAERFVENGAWISHLVLVETTWVLATAFDFDHGAIATAIEMLLDHRQFAIQDADVVEAALRQYRKRPSLGFSDCLILEVATKAGHVPLGTFDRALSRLDHAERL